MCNSTLVYLSRQDHYTTGQLCKPYDPESLEGQDILLLKAVFQ